VKHGRTVGWGTESKSHRLSGCPERSRRSGGFRATTDSAKRQPRVVESVEKEVCQWSLRFLVCRRWIGGVSEEVTESCTSKDHYQSAVKLHVTMDQIMALHEKIVGGFYSEVALHEKSTRKKTGEHMEQDVVAVL